MSDDDTCTPEHCSQADVPMIFRPHTPRTCPALNHEDSVPTPQV